MAKTIDLDKTVYELVSEYPELVDLMAELGFSEITKKAVVRSVGKLMTIPKGAAVKQIPLQQVVDALRAHGFEVVGATAESEDASPLPQAAEKDDPQSRKALLKSYLTRLGAGEELASVREDFAANFSDVDASEIMDAEQELLREGTPLEEVQRLCDVHSALFHGCTAQELVDSMEASVAQALGGTSATSVRPSTNAGELEAIGGHPLSTFTLENQAFSRLRAEFEETGEEWLLDELQQITIHYAKKGDLLYPLLKVSYGISGPSEVMWTVDDEIRDELSTLRKDRIRDEQWHQRLEAVLTRAEEMVFKEQNILFPLCAQHFSEQEWIQIYQDSKDYAPCLGVVPEVWEAAEAIAPESRTSHDAGSITLGGGSMTLEQLDALLNTIPLEITFIDDENINRYFNEGPKVFKRPSMALGREVFSCHPPKVEPMVRTILSDFREGTRDSVPVWMEKGGHTYLVTYLAVRDGQQRYLGAMELVQDMEAAKEHFAS